MGVLWGSLSSPRLVYGATTRRRRPWPPRIFADLFSPSLILGTSRSLAGFFAGRGFLLLEIRAELDDGAHGARMAPRGGLEGPREARQSSRYGRHGAKAAAQERGPLLSAAVRLCHRRQQAQVGLLWASASCGLARPQRFWASDTSTLRGSGTVFRPL